MTDASPAPVTAPATTTPADNGATSTDGVKIGASSTGSDTNNNAPAFDTTAWLAGLDDTSRELATKKNWKSPSDLTKSYVELEKAFSARQADGKPAYKADDYKVDIPANAKDIDYNEDFANGFKQVAIEKGLSPEVFKAVHDWYTNYATELVGKMGTTQAEQLKTQVTSAEAALVKDWGAKNNPIFARNAELAQRAIKQLGIMDDLVDAGAIVQDASGQKVVANAKLFAALAKVGQSMYAEDHVYNDNVSNGENPFDPKTSNSQLQGELIKNDPEKALLLIAALPQGAQQMWAPFLDSIRGRIKK